MTPPISIPGRIKLVKLAASITPAANPSAPSSDRSEGGISPDESGERAHHVEGRDDDAADQSLENGIGAGDADEKLMQEIHGALLQTTGCDAVASLSTPAKSPDPSRLFSVITSFR